MGTKHFGSAEEYANALGTVIAEGVPEKHIELLQAHCLAPRRTRTATELAHHVGYANYSAVNLQYGRLAHRVGSQLGLIEPPRGFWLFVLVNWAGSTDPSGHTRFVLRSPVVEALKKLGYPWARGMMSSSAPRGRGHRAQSKRRRDAHS
jgi:hypothetical protein